jgi:hypothetical protein
MVHARPVATPYDEVLLRNFRAARAAAGLDHAGLAARMQNLGYGWTRATVSKVERRVRALKADEIFGLAYAMKTSITALMTTTPDDFEVAFPAGQQIFASSVFRSSHGVNDGVVDFDAEGAPVIGPPTRPTPVPGTAWPGAD